MINIHLILDSNSYDTTTCVDMKFPAVPRIGDMVSLPEGKEIELVRKILKDPHTLDKHRCWLVGMNTDDISLNIEDACKVKEVDWWPASDGETMECYLTLTEPEKIPKTLSHITEDQWLLARKNTCVLYGFEESDPQEDR